MPFMPPTFLIMWIIGLLSLALLSGGGYILYERWEGAVISTGILASGIAMLVVALLGRFLVLAFHRGGHDDPTWAPSPELQLIKRPDGTVLHVENSGPIGAPTLIFVHGWGAENRSYFYTKRALSKLYRVISWDLRGLGKSSRGGNNDYSIDTMADDLAAVQSLASTPTILIGHSIGGMIVQNFARRYAERLPAQVVACVLVGTTPTDPTRMTIGAPVMHALERPLFVPLMYLMIALSPLIWLMNWLSYINGSLHISTGLTGFAGGETRGQLDFATLFFAKAPPGVMARGMLAMFKFEERAGLENIPVPVLVVANNRDPVLLPRASTLIASLLRMPDYRTLAPARHMGLIERHEDFNEMLGQFIAAQCVAHVTKSS
jgi:pimeloyl-ACP methyl ester carboxylesterase